MKSALIIGGIYVGVYALAYGASYGVYALADKASEKIREAKIKKHQKEEEERDLQRKAEANGWTIVECQYDIEETIEAV